MSDDEFVVAPFERGFEIHGVRVALGGPNPESLDALIALLPPGPVECEPLDVDPRFVLVDAGIGAWRHIGPSGRSPIYSDLALVTAMLDAQMRRWVADNSPDRVFVHAGVVAHQGRAIVIPGSSFSGKTSLVAELVRAGATYYSDEYAIIDDAGLVHPYARPLSVRQPGTQVTARTSAESLGGTTGVEPIPVGLIVSTTYRPGELLRPERRSAGHGMLSLLRHTSHASRNPRQAMAALQQAAATAVVVDGDRGEAADAVPTLLELAAEAVAEGGQRPARPRPPRAQTVGPHDVAFTVYGSRARVAVSSPDLVRTIVAGFPRHSEQCEPEPGDVEFSIVPTPDGGYMVLEDGILRERSPDFDTGLAMLRYQLFYFATHRARDHLVISAATVSHNGTAIVLPGVPKSGKTMLLASLLKAGAVYYADDWTVFGPDGLVIPFATSLRIKGEKVWATDLGATTGEDPITVGLIARVPYVPDARWSVEDLPSREGAPLLAFHSYGREDPAAALRIANQAAASARVIDGVRGDPDKAAAALLELAAQEAAARLA